MTKERLLSVAMVAFGLVSVMLYPLAMVWPSGWAWHSGSPGANDYFLMIVGIYGTLGVLLILAAREPASNLSLIKFAIWSSVVHAGVMTFEALRGSAHRAHLYGDVPALLLAATVLGVLSRGLADGPPRTTAI